MLQGQQFHCPIIEGRVGFEEVRRWGSLGRSSFIGELSPQNSGDSIFDDSRDEVPWYLPTRTSSSTSNSSSSTSAGSVPDIRVLGQVTLQYMFSGKPSSETSSGNSSAFSSTKRTPFAGTLDALSRHLPTSESEVFSIGSSSSQWTYYDILHEYLDQDDARDLSGNGASDNASHRPWRPQLS